ncbi:Ku70/Ku80 beta-barrel domain protein [Gregarina niphandrodes]|uniref:Ku70/Ku80 beta-barrel domain protein n=1 Tax=Gregarina niphandrodes TaxID=110365 RepID=A0A023B8V9_GRENI|nr:Ku70/Ku80 beta-barrel domain protein [Gregarina niphandrodes]EZG70290.1 Ku70/Ku80 beta-barrel domain protein [Gregarina niphandrodes]|eukprot:XP_011129952.1 Ku70/Ku80 beta-barrel domain protein [Gregarina niphandrodes]
MVVRETFYKRETPSLFVVGGETANETDYEGIMYVAVAKLGDVQDLFREWEPVAPQADCFEALLLAVNLLAQSDTGEQGGSSTYDPLGAKSIVVLGQRGMTWNDDEGSEEAISLIQRHGICISFISDEVGGEDEDEGNADEGNAGEGNAGNEAGSRSRPWELLQESLGLDMCRVWSAHDWFLEVMLKPDITKVKPTTTCRLPLEIGELKIPGYVYLCCKSNAPPSLKKGTRTMDEAEASQTGAEIAPVVQSRVAFAEDEAGLASEQDKEEIISAYLYGDKLIPLGEIDKDLPALPPEDKALKLVHTVTEEAYESFFIFGSTSFLVPDPSIPNSLVGYKFLADALRKSHLGIVARLKSRSNYPPKLVLLTPLTRPDKRTRVRRHAPTEQGNTNSSNIDPRLSDDDWRLDCCLIMNNLPFREDIRNYGFISHPIVANRNRLDAAIELIQNNKLESNTPLVWNPTMRNFVQHLIFSIATDNQQVSGDDQLYHLPKRSLEIPKQFMQHFQLSNKRSRAEEKQKVWKQAVTNTVSLNELFDTVIEDIQFDSADPVKSLNELAGRYKSNTDQMKRIISQFGDVIVEDMLVCRGANFPKFISAFSSIGHQENSAVADEYNSVLEQIVSVVKLNRNVFSDIESEITNELFIINDHMPEEKIVQLIKELKTAPKELVTLPTQSTQEVQSGEPVFEDDEFDDLE